MTGYVCARYFCLMGSGLWETNLDRLTVITTAVFIVCVIVMAITFPTATLGVSVG